MKNSYFSNSIAFLLLAFMLLKVSSFHSYIHNDSCDFENCKSCELAAEIENNEFTAIIPEEVPSVFYTINTHEPSLFYDLVPSLSFFHTCFFGRPPPHVV